MPFDGVCDFPIVDEQLIIPVEIVEQIVVPESEEDVVAESAVQNILAGITGVELILTETSMEIVAGQR